MERINYIYVSKFTVISVLLTFMLLALSISSVYANDERGVTKDTIKFGQLIDLTGPVANDGRPIYEAIKTFYRHINDDGGIHGRKIKFIVEDDRYSVPAAMAAFKKLVFKDKVLYIQGPSGSSQMVALIGQAEKSRIPIISVTVGKKIIEPYKRFNFTMASLYKDQQAVIFDFIMNDLKAKNPRIAYLYPDTEYGKRALEAARSSAERYGIKMVKEEVLNVGAIDASSAIMNLKRVSPDYVINQGVLMSVVTFIKDAKKFKFKSNYIGVYAACTEQPIKMFRGSEVTYYGNNCYSSWYENEPGVVNMRQLTLKYKPGTEEQYLKHYTKLYTVGWLLSSIYVEGLKRAGRDLNAETLVDALETFREVGFGGLSGPITYTSKSHKANSYSKMYKADVEKGIFIPLGGWRKPIGE